MPKLTLPDITLFCADCINVDRAVHSIERCKAVCDFGDVKFMTSCKTDYPHVEIPPLKTLVEYSIWMLKRSHEFVSTPKFLVVQHDAWVITPEAWNPAWMEYDYVAPIFTQCPAVGSGGFSLRTTKLMQVIAERLPAWDLADPVSTARMQQAVGCYEDGHISNNMRPYLEALGYRFAPVSVANQFAQGGNPDPVHRVATPFGFHREGAIGLVSPNLPKGGGFSSWAEITYAMLDLGINVIKNLQTET